MREKNKYISRDEKWFQNRHIIMAYVMVIENSPIVTELHLIWRSFWIKPTTFKHFENSTGLNKSQN